MSDRVQVVLWREMGETTFSLVGLGDHPAGLGWASARCALLLLLLLLLLLRLGGPRQAGGWSK